MEGVKDLSFKDFREFEGNNYKIGISYIKYII